MSKKQIWWLDINQVERIKNGVLKYINLNQASKSKQKSAKSPSPSIPQSPLTKPKTYKLDKKDATKNKQTLDTSIEQKTKKKSVGLKGEDTQKMPKGYHLNNKGKIIRQNPQKTKIKTSAYESQLELQDISFSLENPSFSKLSQSIKQQQKNKTNALGKQKLKKQNKIGSISEEDIQLEAYDNILTVGLNLFGKNVTQSTQKIQVKPIIQVAKQKQKQKQKVEVVKQEPKVAVQEQKKTMSFSELAKMYGGSSLKKANPIQAAPPKNENIVEQKKPASVSELAKLYGASSAKKPNNIQTAPNTNEVNKISKNNEDNDSKSIYSFGSVGRQSNNSSITIENSIKSRQMPTFNERKRAMTYQQQIKESPLQQIQYKQSYKIPSLTKNEYDKYATSYIIESEPEPQFKSITFTTSQSDTLKKKYNLLSTRLDYLKAKVIQQCQFQMKPMSPRSLRIIREQIQTRKSIDLYQKYSPLKKLQKKIKQRNQENLRKQIKQKYPKSKQLSFYLRK